jgi:hypothetical protein
MERSTISRVSSLASSLRLTGSPRAAFCGPALGEFLVDLADQAAELIDDAAVKGGLHHAPLPAPEIALAGHDAVAEQDLDPIHALALGVVAMVRQQHPLDVVGVVDDVVVDAAAGREHPIDVAEFGEIVAQRASDSSLPPRSKPSAGPGGSGRVCIRPIVT